MIVLRQLWRRSGGGAWLIDGYYLSRPLMFSKTRSAPVAAALEGEVL